MQVRNKFEGMMFLLGGHDLEMLTIRKVLDKAGIKYADHGLRWDNACLSSYRKELDEASDKGWTVWGIELQEDIVLPPCYKRIDHHNDLAHLPSALEQVLEVLHLPMDRYLQLVAANDKAYIPGMLQLNATAAEVEVIRRADRKAQGVTDKDELLAEKAIAENCKKVGNLLVVHALSPRFSPICDRLFPYRCLLVYTDDEWIYYGEGAMLVRKCFEDDFLAGKLFCGGGENGYVGTAKGKFLQEELDKMILKIQTV